MNGNRINRASRLFGKLLKMLRAGGCGVLFAASLAGAPAFAEDTIDSLVDQAQRSLETGQAQTAVIQAKNALQRDPQHARALLLLSRAYIALEEPLLALRQLEQARLMGADEARVREFTARAYLQQQDFKRLLDQVENASDLPAPGQATILALRGLAQLNLGHDDEAEEELDAALSLDSDSIDAHLGFARLALKNRAFDRAEMHLRKARDQDADNVDLLLVTGELGRLQSEYAKAADAFNGVLERRPENTLALLGLAAVFLDQGKLNAAEKHLNVVLRKWPSHPIGNYLRGELLYRSGKRDEAKSALRLALAVMPGHLPSHMLLGGIEFADGHPDRAAKHLTRFIDARPDQLAARKLLAASYLKLDQPKKALEVLTPMLGRSDADAQLHSLAGATFIRLGESEKASEHYAKAVELDPEAVNARMELFVSLLLSDAAGEADKELQETIELGTDPVQVSVMRTQLLLTKKSYDEALQEAKQLQAHAPDNPTGYNLAGVAYLGKSMRPQAEQQFREALRVAPEFSLAAMNLATLALQASDQKTARKYYEDVLRHHPDHAGAHQGLAELAKREGKTEEMVSHLEQARKSSASALEPRMHLYAYRLQHGDTMAALDLAQEMADSQPDNPEVLRALGIAEQAAKLIKRAVGTFERLVELQPDSADAHALYADALASYGNFDAARKELQEALRLDPDYLRAHIGLGALEARVGDRPRALQIAADVQQRHQDHSAGFELEGDLRLEAGEFARAAEAFGQANQRAPSARLAQKRFRALRDSQQHAQAYAVLREWLDQHPDDIETRVLLAKAYQIDGQMQQAAQTYLEVLEAQPDRADVMNNLAWIYLGREPEQALAWAEKAYALSPDNPAVIDTYGWVMFQHNDKATGLGLLQEALLKAPQNSEIRFHVAQALEQVGNHAEAHRHVKQILHADTEFSDRANAEAMLQRLESR